MDNRVTYHADDEIRLINATVSIEEVAEALGYVKDRDKSSRTSQKYTRDGDMIVVRNSQHHPGQEYFTIAKGREEGDNGPAFNFVFFREGARNMGKTRKILRSFLSGKPHNPVILPPRTQTITEATNRQDEWEALIMTPAIIKKHVVDHLLTMGLTRETLLAFRGLVRADHRKNACFASRLHDGIVVGWSLRGTQDKRFRSHHGQKALFWGPAGGQKKTERLVVTESALDAISYWQLFGNEIDIMVSATAGNTGDYGQVVQLARALDARQVIIATDADEAGQAQGQALAAALDAAGVEWFPHRPPPGTKDWNKYLLAQLKKKEAA